MHIFALIFFYNENLYYLLFLHKSYIWEKSCSWVIDFIVLSQSDCRIFKSTISSEQMYGTASFFACWHKFTKKLIKNGWCQSGLWTLSSTVSQEWTDGINWFFACLWYVCANQKLIENFWDGYGQKWVWTVWSQESKTDCILKMNGWNKLIFCMGVQIQESLKIHCWFLDAHSQKQPWPFSLWDSKTCYVLRINLWIKLNFGILIVIQ